ncbi:protein yippee-like F37A8.5 isoform X3 [Camellia sinensis]|nr:protein yippee-like F37A8.5 isoform X3 [Camellia sinensis]
MFQEPGVCFYRCCQCSTTLAFTDHLVSKDIVKEAAILTDVQNVTAAGPYQIDSNNLVADVTCNGCNSLLGWKYVRVPQRNYAVQPRRFLLQFRNKLLMWDGKNMLYADTRMVTFHQIPNARFFLCRQCNTHIALNEDFMIRIPDIMINAGIFEEVVNVDVAGKAHYRMQCTDTVADVNCSGCRKLLGWKYIEVPKEEAIFLKAGTFLLHLNMLLKWNGTNMQCADYTWNC